MPQLAVSREPSSAFRYIPGFQPQISAFRYDYGSSKPFPAPLNELRPTQMAVGMRAVAAKREKVERRTKSRRKLRRYLEERPVPAVLGPDDDLFIIDHHHLSLALWQSDVEEAFVTVVSDLSHLLRDRFLRRMTSLGMLHAFDAHGRSICPTRLPETLGALRNDPFRDLAWSVREARGFAKTAAPYAEFRWANFFRNRVPRSTVMRDFDLAHDRAMWLARSRKAAQLPGYIGG